MPCFRLMRTRAKGMRLRLSENITDKDVQELLNAIDHGDVHRILENLTDERFV